MPILQNVLSIVVLGLYCVDLWGPNVRDISQLIVWVGLFVLPAFWSLMQHFVLSSSSNGSSNGSSGGTYMVSMFVALAHCGVELITWLCLASALMLQFLESDANFGE